MYVNLNHNSIKGKTVNMDSHIKNFASNINSINTILANINDVWQGADHDFFNAQMEKFISDMYKMQESLESFNEFIKGYLITGEKLDDAYQNKKIYLK